ncbi:2-succinyl-5-enolpyruvyl-6-hydroxy-3-cyclohexene-1-carboxylic-acid synthase [Cryobacterium sp. TMT2-18-3]|uniref:2-succinyl-5-enolpyruvyl-6-hydroxy-3- cyclohexene-1-carboxylic-acid synthase n=1 Tax=unclassified Cryobacterium TaxID=2649013 RepID=UPI00106D955C|nr:MULTISPECIES: 2-succinyl-5-enolpyruvyl-6-hydroxy-3-cyclohexene-1-carboxylic-acid synthase [unclassified Cryobacterium]TFC29462.1 2-succinyl-5-enolpyruvyl-6-hydroxy-3-cyclohexene-1-carboxylic-acid synthase [Cryobacterium sp. TMT2-18-2]TFC37515.1 2-succinyl-5-enolpyruvyl-6-hydroxy-3-cyclohexene-1-carboxylic-acid synthase [Cryobacterium sp. TMT2-42-4]TFC61608.1 2-succinyl-5-enolpyruvyl-6-hydroxy-3-cyclohexene-1-carboxylic-acid synthase [Cryobacterium sp. TMT2-18-3]
MPDIASSGSPATDFSVSLLGEFVRLGVRDLVLSPGARSQALALAAAELERIGLIRLHVRLDERGAGFLALGLAVEAGRPALVVCTSGTAVANLHPAVLEAHHSGVPMILLTADRPSELRGIRSNQTTLQPGLFGVATRLCVDASAPEGAAGEHADAIALARQATDAATGATSLDPGPVQLNLAFREPLSAPVALTPEAISGPVGLGESAAVLAAPVLDASPTEPVFPVTGGPRTVVIAGTGAGPEAEEFARTGGWPLLAEVCSGARFGPNLVSAYRELLLASDLGGRVERAVVFGHPTLSREVPAMIVREGVETIVVAPTGTEWFNPGHRVRVFARAAAPDAAAIAAAESLEGREWLGRWVMSSRHLLAAGAARESIPIGDRGITREELAAMRAPVTRPMLVDAVWRASWPHDRLVFGASRLVRVADRRVPGKKISVHSNRGLAGIDGTVATAVGIALASQTGPTPQSTGVTRLVVGDLTLLHDVGSLLLTPGEALPRLQIIVGNDGGGTIFDGLEVAASARADAINRVLFTPQQADLANLAAAYGWSYGLAATRSDLERALTAPHAGPSILEVPLVR